MAVVSSQPRGWTTLASMKRTRLLLLAALVLVVLYVSLYGSLAPSSSSVLHAWSPHPPKTPPTHDSSSSSSTSATTTSDHHASKNLCPNAPPSPSYSPPKPQRGHFNWRALKRKNPIPTPYAQLPPLSRLLTQPLPNRIQHDFSQGAQPQQQPLSSPADDEARINTQASRREAVKQAFARGWASYKKHAWGKDELMPVSGGSKNTFGGWGATLVDSLDTLWIMGMKDEFAEAVDAAVKIDFSPSTLQSWETINMFETTIRYLGGFLAAYDLPGCSDTRLLAKAVELADMIYASFDTPNFMPVTRWSPQRAADGEEQLPAMHGIIAEVASSSLELTRLSQLTGDMRYFDAAQRITDVLDEQQMSTKLPGLWPVGCNVRSSDFASDNSFSLGAMADSAFEYLPKMYALVGGEAAGKLGEQYARMHSLVVEAAAKYLFFRPLVPGDDDILVSGLARASNPEDASLTPEGQHLTCFMGGTLALGGKLLGNETHVALGRKLTEGCAWAYRNAPAGIMPEVFNMVPCYPSASGGKEECVFNENTWNNKHGHSSSSLPAGFTSINDAQYKLRPEAIESVFYLYRITGDTRFQDIAWSMFEAIEKHTKTDYANAAIDSVAKENPDKQDSMESFWLAETLKYFYLVFSEPDLISLDDFVFNTEAHPLRLPK